MKKHIWIHLKSHLILNEGRSRHMLFGRENKIALEHF